jgi:hypothetical protein
LRACRWSHDKESLRNDFYPFRAYESANGVLGDKASDQRLLGPSESGKTFATLNPSTGEELPGGRSRRGRRKSAGGSRPRFCIGLHPVVHGLQNFEVRFQGKLTITLGEKLTWDLVGEVVQECLVRSSRAKHGDRGHVGAAVDKIICQS